MSVTIKLRRNTAAGWTSGNITLASGEPGYEKDTGLFKIGNGATPWNSLPYSSGFWGEISGDITNQSDLQTALGTKASATDFSNHSSNTNNPHSVTKTQLGLGNVDNTSDNDKPISSATQSALNNKLAKGDDGTVPTLGQQYQVLAKVTNDAYDYAWQTINILIDGGDFGDVAAPPSSGEDFSFGAPNTSPNFAF